MAETHEDVRAMETRDSSLDSRRTDPQPTAEDRNRLTLQLLVQDAGYLLHRAARPDQHETPSHLNMSGVNPDAAGLAYPTPVTKRLKLFWSGPHQTPEVPRSDVGHRKNDYLCSLPRHTSAWKCSGGKRDAERP